MKTEKKQIWVICEIINGGLSVGSRQMISKAKYLAKEMNADVSVILPAQIEDRKSLEHTPGTHIFYCSYLKSTSGGEYANKLSDIIAGKNSLCVMLSDNRFWKEVAVRLAIRLNVGLIADCINIVPHEDKQQLVYTRMVYSEAKMARITTKGDAFGICTIKKNVFDEGVATDSSAPLSYSYPTETNMVLPTNNIRVTDRTLIQVQDQDISLEGRKIILGIGRGIEIGNLKKVWQIAKKIHAGVGFSKPVADSQSGSGQNQIGQSGKFITCNLYIAFGISGSIHHLCAIQRCKKVIAVNLDANAPIAHAADIFIHADANLVIDALHHAIVSLG